LAVPTAIPVTTPVELTVAIEVALLDHVPPVTDSDKVVVVPIQAVAVPVIAAIVGFTVMTAVSADVEQPLPVSVAI